LEMGSQVLRRNGRGNEALFGACPGQ